MKRCLDSFPVWKKEKMDYGGQMLAQRFPIHPMEVVYVLKWNRDRIGSGTEMLASGRLSLLSSQVWTGCFVTSGEAMDLSPLHFRMMVMRLFWLNPALKGQEMQKREA